MSEPFMGTVMIWAPNFAPRGWAFCQGQIMSISTNSALFSLLGVVYGGNGQTTFGLPNLAGRVPVGQGQSPGTSTYTLGQMSGTEQVSLTTAQMPAHIHTATFTSTAGGGTVNINAYQTPAASATPGGTNSALAIASGEDTQTFNSVDVKVYGPATGTPVTIASATVAAPAGTVAVNPNGSSLPFSILQPYQVLNYVIALEGVFPSRN